MTRLVPVLLVALLVSACAYFNALYNAQRMYTQAERAQARGHEVEARNAYEQSIEKAARSLRRSPEGRWSDDALYLIGRAHFALGEYEKARVALARIESSDRTLAAGALAYLGASEHRMADHAAAVQRLDESLEHSGGRGQLAAFAHLWRGRARFALGEDAQAWGDLSAAISVGGPLASEARLEQAARAVALRQEAPLRSAAAGFAASGADPRAADSLSVLLRAAAAWNPALARELLGTLAGGPLQADTRSSLRYTAAEILLQAGDTAHAEQELQLVAARGEGPSVHRARIQMARIRLAAATELEELGEIRAILLPSVGQVEVRSLLTSMQAVLVLLERARETGQPLALFTAAEMARDELRAPALARSLFIGYADVATGGVWTGKALLAALALRPGGPEGDEVRARLEAIDTGPYVAAVRGVDDPALYASAEDRLGRITSELRRTALNEAAVRDPSVVRAVVVLDSLRAIAVADSMRVPCGNFVDSLGITGEFADSVRSACLRRDSVRVDSLMSSDTTRAEAPRSTPRDSTRL